MPMTDREALAHFKRRPQAIVAEMEQLHVDQEYWNAVHPHEEPLDELRGMRDEVGKMLASIDAKITRLEQRLGGTK